MRAILFLACLACVRTVFAQDTATAAILQVIAAQTDYNCDRPGDLDIAVGPDRIVVGSNCTVQLWTRTEPPVLLASGEAFLRQGSADMPMTVTPGLFEGIDPADLSVSDEGSRVFDGRTYWDADSERFFVIAPEHGNSTEVFDFTVLRIAVSKTSSPNSFDATQWHTFTIDFKTDISEPLSHPSVPVGGFLDLPRSWIGDDYLYVCVGAVIDLLDPVTARDGPGFLAAIPKTPLLSGTKPATPYWGQRMWYRPGIDCGISGKPGCVETTSRTFFHGAARTYGLAGDRMPLFLAPEDAVFVNGGMPMPDRVQDELVLGSLVAGQNGTFTYVSTKVALPSGLYFAFEVDGGKTPEAGETAGHSSAIFHSIVFRGESLWATLHARAVVPDGSGGYMPSPLLDTKVYWFEIDPDGYPAAGASPAVVQGGIIDPQALGFPGSPGSDAEAFDPSIAVNSLNTVAITFTVSSSTEWPSIYRAIRYQTQPANTMPNIARVRKGNGLQPDRWSDYSGTSPDPTNACIFWGHSLQTELPTSNPPLVDQWESYLTKYRVCNSSQNSFADVDGDGEVSMKDYDEFLALFRAGDRRGDANADGFHDMLDVLMISDEMAARGIVR